MVSRDFQDFCKGYMDAALWTGVDDNDEPLDARFDRDDIASDSKRKMKNVCAKFFRKNRRDLKEYAENVVYQPHEGSAMAYAGHDFWLTANGHGAGFWDREGIDKALGRRLSDASKKFSSYLYVGDDGKVHVD